MKGFVISCCLLASAQALGCDARGVSLGSEEPCELDPRFATALATTDEPVSNCAELGDNVLVNASFESPVVSGCFDPLYCQFPAENLDGWSTTSETQIIEIWRGGYLNVPAPDGSQLLELDAESQDTISQDVALPPLQLMYWSLLHRGRNDVETMEVRIGPPGATLLQRSFSSDADAWYPFSGLYRVGPDEPLTRLELVSRSGTAEGNLVDAVVFAPVQ